MKQITKKTLSILLAVIMLVCAVPFAASAVTYSGECGAEGDNLTWSVDADTATLTISGEGEMANYSYSTSAPWNSYSNIIAYLTIGENVTSIGDYAFVGLSKVKTINIPKNIIKIGIQPFHQQITVDEDSEYCSIDENGVIFSEGNTVLAYATKDLYKYEIPEGVEYINKNAFIIPLDDWNGSLKELTIPSSIKSLKYDAFNIRNIPKLFVDRNNLYYSSDEYGVLFNKDKTILYFAPRSGTDYVYCNINKYFIPNTVKTISEYAFYGYHTGDIANIPESVATIGDYAFATDDDYSNSNLYLPSSVISLGENISYYNISTYFGGTKEQWNQISGHDNYHVIEYEHKHDFYETVGCATIKTCKTCKFSELKAQTADHNLEESDRVNATCIEDGYIEYRCQKCRETKREIIASTGVHNWYGDTYDPTCTKDGSWWRECSVCGKYESGTIPATGHNYILEETIAPNCTVDQYEFYYCQYCNDYYHKLIPALGHEISTEWVVEKEATCTTEGIKSHHCTRCDEIIDPTPIEKAPHDYYIKNLVMPLCNKDGSMTHVCIGCGDSYVVVLPSTNTHSDADNDGNCDACGKQISGGTTTPSEPSKPSTDDCDCMCHKSGFVGFIWNFIKVFYKVFRTNKTCACGVAHY